LPRKHHFALGLLTALVLAIALRCPLLDVRPMHNDEAVNAIKFGQLWTHGAYQYDPHEYHGPTLHYATFALEKLARAPGFDQFTSTRLRLVTVFFGLGLVLLLPLVADGLGRGGAVWAAVFTAVSPALVFYSRDFIHETLLVFFVFLALAACWRYWQSRRVAWALLAGAGVGLLTATKETFVLNLAAAILALALNQGWNRFLDASRPPAKPHRLNPWHLAAGLGVCLFVAFALFSSFFTHLAGVLDAIRTFAVWLPRAGASSPHIHPWHFYLHRLLFFHPARGPVWTEALILVLGVIGARSGFVRPGLAAANASLVRFLALYTLLLTAAYSVVSYKTPWCLLSFWHGTILLAGVGAAVLVDRAKPGWSRLGVGAVVAAGAAHLAWQAWLASVPYSADRRNPYVYAQTSPDLLNLVHEVESLALFHPEGRQMFIKVMAPDGDYWPLPWYLHTFKRVGWWSEVPPDPFAPVMIVSPTLHARLDDTKTHVMAGYFELRPQVFLELYVQSDLWQRWLATRSRSLGTSSPPE
jgi:uncharacterized protein (TIGR03663 family)